MTMPTTEDDEWDLSGLLIELDPPPDGLERLHRRARQQRRLHRSLVAVGAAAVLVGAGLGIPTLSGPARPHSSLNVTDRPSPPTAPSPTGSRLPPAPAPASAAPGAAPVDWGDVRVWLPPSWTVSPGEATCDGGGLTGLANGSGIGLAPCQNPSGDAALTIQRLVQSRTGGRRTTIDGIAVVEHVSTAGQRVDVPSWGTELLATTASARAVLATLQPSVSYDLLHTYRFGGPGPGWRTVTYRDVSVDVPARWNLEPAGFPQCGELGSGGPVVVRGPESSVANCGARPPGAAVTTQGGLSMNTVPDTSTIGPSVVERRGSTTLTLSTVAGTPAEIDIRIEGTHPMDLQAAIGPDPGEIGRVIASIRRGR